MGEVLRGFGINPLNLATSIVSETFTEPDGLETLLQPKNSPKSQYHFFPFIVL